MKRVFRFVLLFNLIACFVFLIISVSRSMATERIVSPGESIQAAIVEASDGDVIILQKGIYYENINFLGKAITVKSTDPNNLSVVAETIIDGNQQARVVLFDNGEGPSSVLDGITLQNGNADLGGGIGCNQSSPTIKNCRIVQNTATVEGGGIYFYYSSPFLINCIIEGNTASNHGGGISCNNLSPSIVSCSVTKNNTTFNGGGIHCYQSDPNIMNSIIEENSAGNVGGGIHCDNSSSPVITNCFINKNQASLGGGGIACVNSSSSMIRNCHIEANKTISSTGVGAGIGCHKSSPSIMCCYISYNESSHEGGGVWLGSNADAEIINCVISFNTADNLGGGIYCETSGPALVNCTIGANTSTHNGGGIYCKGSSPIIKNCILWFDTPDEIYIESGTPVVTFSDIQLNLNNVWPGAGNINIDPKFADPNGYLLESSPCIDAGTQEDAPSNDKDGKPRPIGSGYDIGAYEYEAPFELNLGLVEQWINDFGNFNAVKILKNEDFKSDGDRKINCACCATSEGLIILGFKNNNNSMEVYVKSFVPIPAGNCMDLDILIEKGEGNNNNVFAFIITGSEAFPPLYSSFQGGLYIFNITNPESPYFTSSCLVSGYDCSIDVAGDYAFISSKIDYPYGSLQVIDITKKSRPALVGTCEIPSTNEIVIDGNYAYLATNNKGLQVMDISNKDRPPIKVRNYPTLGSVRSISIFGDYAFVSCAQGFLNGYGYLQVIAIDPNSSIDPNSMIESYFFSDVPNALVIDGNYAYIAIENNGLMVVEIDPNNLIGPGSFAGSYQSYREVQGIAIAGNYAFLACSGFFGGLFEGNLEAIDISDKKELVKVGGYPQDSVVPQKMAIDGCYAYVTGWLTQNNLHVFDICSRNSLMKIGSYTIPGPCSAYGIAIKGNYAYVATTLKDYTDDRSGALQVIDINNPISPKIVGSCHISDAAYGVAINGYYAYVAAKFSGLQVIDIRDANMPMIKGSCDIPGIAYGIAIDDNYAYVAAGDKGLQVIDIKNPDSPKICGSCNIPGPAVDVVIYGNYAYVGTRNDRIDTIEIIDLKSLAIVSNYQLQDECVGFTLVEDYLFVVDWGGIQKFKLSVNFDPSPKGNLILVAGGSNDYNSPYFQAVQSLANQVFHAFINNGYEVCDIYYINPISIQYINPISIQDTDDDGFPDQLVVDDPVPSSENLKNVIEKLPDDHISNEGPLYIYLIGHGGVGHRGENYFQIMPNEVITGEELRECIDRFQEYSNRQVVVIIESGASGSFIDNLIGDNITVISSTDDGSSYIKPDITLQNSSSSISMPQDYQFSDYLSFTSSFIKALDPNIHRYSISDTINDFLKEAFINAKSEVEGWALQGPSFVDQSPQMVLSGNFFSSLSFSYNGKESIHRMKITQYDPNLLTIIGQDPNGTVFSFTDDLILTIIGQDPNGTVFSFTDDLVFFSSDPNILDINQNDSIEDMDRNGLPCYRINPRKNGTFTLIAYPDPDSDLLLSAKITFEVFIDDPSYYAGKGKMAVIIAGYQKTGDYLWESTNNIANHAYKTLRAMGYTKEEIHYYTPYLLQELDEEEGYDEVRGYPKLSILDPNNPMSPFYEKINDTEITELFLFFTDHGNRGTFCINPKETLLAGNFIDQIAAITDHVEKKIIFLYDACYSGSFLDEIEKRIDTDPYSPLPEKLIAITSTDPNQRAYYLNQGMVSFSYPFFDEWFLTHSIKDAFDYAKSILPLTGQTPCITNPDLYWSWDLKNRFFIDESRPLIDEVEANRSEGKLHITANVYSLTGINQVWAMVESTQKPLKNMQGEAITEASKLYLTRESGNNFYSGVYKLMIPDPCPNEINYILSIYASDNSIRPKIASYKTAIGEMGENKTVALIFSSSPDLYFPEKQEEKEKLCAQIERAEASLISKGLNKDSIIRITRMEDLENLTPLAKDQILFIYLIGQVELQEDDFPYFLLNLNEVITPASISAIPQGPNSRLLVIMDAPYGKQFLSCIPWQDNWAGIASTNQEYLFFPIDEFGISFSYELFPCFSNFFFSMILSGRTVAQAYRIARNAVSLTRQNPGLFPPERFLNYKDINRHLGYYLGSSAIAGEEDSLFTKCEARTEMINGKQNYLLSMSSHPKANIIRAWTILTSPSAIHQKSEILDLNLDEDQTESMYKAELPSGHQYYQAHFMVEGYLNGESGEGKNWIEWEILPIVKTVEEVDPVELDEDDDPNSVLHNIMHEIIVNVPPQRQSFYCDQQEGCQDIDWVYFYALKDHIYEIYAQDLSEYGYFIQLALYDSNISSLEENGQYLISNNYLAFDCKQSGYYLLKAQLASSYPPEGVEYIMGIADPEAGAFTQLFLELIDPIKGGSYCVKGQTGDNEYIYPDDYLYIYPDRHYYKFKNLTPYKSVSMYIFEGNDYVEPYLKKESRTLLPFSLNLVSSDLSDVDLDPTIYKPCLNSNYELFKDEYESDISDSNDYPWRDAKFGDKDPNFPPDGDYDGDRISNIHEIIGYESSPHYPSIPLRLQKGRNLYYFPSVKNEPHFAIRNDQIYKIKIFKFLYSGMWKDIFPDIQPNAYNYIYTPYALTCCIDLKDMNHAILCLKDFVNPNDAFHEDTDPNRYLNENEIWSRFIQVEQNPNSIFPMFSWDPDEIRTQTLMKLQLRDKNGYILVMDMTATNAYQTKESDASTYIPGINLPVLLYSITPVTWYRDADDDGCGDPNDSIRDLDQHQGYVADPCDCDDTEPTAYSGAAELCDSIDNDCNGYIDDGFMIFSEGWRMISLPVMPYSAKLSDLFPDAVVVYHYEKGEGYVRINKGEELVFGSGYWILLDQNQNYCFPGQPIQSYTIPVYEDGWKMIGGCSDPVKASVDKGNIAVIYRFEPGSGYVCVRESEYLMPGEGYWILLNGVSTLKLMPF